MTAWTETDEAAAFIATADSRQTDKHIMEAISFHAANLAEAEAIWAGDFPSAGIVGNVRENWLLTIWDTATNNGSLDGYEMFWGDAGNLNEICGCTQPKFLEG